MHRKAVCFNNHVRKCSSLLSELSAGLGHLAYGPRCGPLRLAHGHSLNPSPFFHPRAEPVPSPGETKTPNLSRKALIDVAYQLEEAVSKFCLFSLRWNQRTSRPDPLFAPFARKESERPRTLNRFRKRDPRIGVLAPAGRGR